MQKLIPNKRPVFLFAFANDEQASLQLGEEENVCWNELAVLHQEGKIDCQRMGFATLDQLYREFNRFKDQIYIFHYGGHSDKGILKLHGTAGSAENLGEKIGQLANLKLAFLNGCKNFQQVEVLFEKGVPAIIATMAPIEDKRAINLAQQFYQALAAGDSIRDAFASAKSFIFDKHPELKASYRGQGLVEEEGGVFSWGLYPRNGSALDWSISDIETETRMELIQTLRNASQKRHQKFIGKGGRFQYLKINETILTGIVGLQPRSTDLIEDHIQLDGQQQTLWQTLPDLWGKESTHAIVVGPGGMGKTVSLVRIWHQLLEDDQFDTPVPIFIQLNEFNNRPEKDFIRNYTKAHYADLDLDELLKNPILTKTGEQYPSVILLLDGINEVTAQSNELLMEINQLRVKENYPGVQLVLTSRVDLRAAYQWQAFHLLELQALTDGQIKNYLDKAMPGDSRLVEVLRNPMMLSIYAAQSELPDRYKDNGYLKQKVSSIGEMLYNVEAIQRIKIEKAFENEGKEIAYRRFVLEHLLPFIGWEMQQAGLFFIQKKSMSQVVPGLQDLLDKGLQNLLNDDLFDTFDFFNQNLKEERFSDSSRQLFNEIIEEIAGRELTILVRDGGNYRFLHQHFQDYFAARHVQNQIDIALQKNELPEVFRKDPLDYYVRQLLGELEEEHTNTMEFSELKKKWQWSKGQFFLNNRLTSLLEQCRGVFDPKHLGYMVWNILTIWKEQRGELSGADLRRLNCQGLSLNGQRLSRQNLKASLSEVLITIESLFPQGHSASVKSAVYSPDGGRILTGSSDNTAKVWDAKTGFCLLSLEGHSDRVNSAVYSLDEGRILTASDDKTAKVWDAQTGTCILILEGHWSMVNSAVYSPNSECVLTASDDNTAKVWDAHTGACILTLEGHSSWINSAVYSPNGKHILTGSDNTAKVWDAITGDCLLTLEDNSDSVTSAVYSPDGSQILTALDGNSVKVWDVQTGACLLILEGHSDSVMSAVYNPNGTFILTASVDRMVKVWSVETGDCILTIENLSSTVSCAIFNLDGTRILTGSGDNTAKVWDAKTGLCLLTLEGHSRLVMSATQSLYGTRILTGSSDETAKVWDTETSICLLTLEGHSSWINSAIYSLNENFILTASSDHTAKVWDAKTGACRLTLEGHSAWITCALYSFDGKLILTASSDKTARVWEAETGVWLLTLTGHTSWVRSVVYSPNGARILTASYDDTAKVWNAETGDCLLTLTGHSGSVNCAVYSPEGKYILTASDDKTARVWDAKTGVFLLPLKNISSRVFSVAYSPDGQRIVGGLEDHTAQVWNAKTGSCLLTLRGHSGRVNSGVYSPNGKHILTASDDKTTRLWDPETGDCLLTLENISGLFIQGCDFRNLHQDSNLSEEVLGLLRQYGGIFDDDDEERWAELMEKHFGD